MKDLEFKFRQMVSTLQSTEFNPKWDPRLLHGFQGISSEACEILEMCMLGGTEKNPYVSISPLRTEMLIELSDLLHFLEYVMIVYGISIAGLEALLSKTEIPSGPMDGINMRGKHGWVQPRDTKIFLMVLGLVTSTGYLLNRYKKYLYYHEEVFTEAEVVAGLARVYYFILETIKLYDSSIDEVIEINTAKLGCRYPNGFTHHKGATVNRDPLAEKAAIQAVVDRYLQRAILQVMESRATE